MGDEFDVAQSYLARAETLCKIADEDGDENNRLTLLRIATGYVGMAENFMAIDRANRPVRRLQ